MSASATESASSYVPTLYPQLDMFERERAPATSVSMSPRYLCGGALRVYSSCLSESWISALRRAFIA